MWQRSGCVNPFRQLYELVTPEKDRNESLLKRFPDRYRAYYLEENNTVVAFGVIGWLPKNKVWMIDLFALDPSIRGQGRARTLFHYFRDSVANQWPKVKEGKDHYLLEAYLHNIVPWCKIMNMTET